MGFARVLRETPVFERLTLSDEDRERGRYYTEQRQRLELERSASSLEDFLPLLTTGNRDLLGNTSNPHSGLPANAKDQPIQSDNATLQRATNSGAGEESCLGGLCGPRQRSSRRQWIGRRGDNPRHRRPHRYRYLSPQLPRGRPHRRDRHPIVPDRSKPAGGANEATRLVFADQEKRFGQGILCPAQISSG